MLTITNYQFWSIALAGVILGAAGWHWFMVAIIRRRERQHREMIQRFVAELKEHEQGE